VRAGDAQLGNHLCLLVCLDQRYLVDVGFGGSLVEMWRLGNGFRIPGEFVIATAAAPRTSHH
jgi:arylamine N-acetyltransferase